MLNYRADTLCITVILVICLVFTNGFTCLNRASTKSALKYGVVPKISMIPQHIQHILTSDVVKSSFYLSDTSISEEEVLDVVGTSTNLPDPLYAIAFAGVIFLGVGILQLSLGDLTKEEGQARVRDFLKTRGDTERKRGYFD